MHLLWTEFTKTVFVLRFCCFDKMLLFNIFVHSNAAHFSWQWWPKRKMAGDGQTQKLTNRHPHSWNCSLRHVMPLTRWLTRQFTGREPECNLITRMKCKTTKLAELNQTVTMFCQPLLLFTVHILDTVSRHSVRHHDRSWLHLLGQQCSSNSGQQQTN